MGNTPALATLRLTGRVITLMAWSGRFPGWPDSAEPGSPDRVRRALDLWAASVRRVPLGKGEIWLGRIPPRAVGDILTFLERWSAPLLAPTADRQGRAEGRTIALALDRALRTLRDEGWTADFDGRRYRITWPERKRT